MMLVACSVAAAVVAAIWPADRVRRHADPPQQSKGPPAKSKPPRPPNPADCGAKCSGHGRCTRAGCRCDPDWAGRDCRFQLRGRKTWEVVPGCDAVDVVFTWVNGSDPQLIADTNKHGPKYGRVELAPQRTRDLGQLRYGLRSVLEHLPWVRHIWVVSGTPCPSWLNSSHTHVSYVPHRDIFPRESLPALNSNTIQSRLVYVPNVAMRFLSMDDDYLITRDTPPSALLGQGLQGTLQWWRGRWRPGLHMKSSYRNSLERTLRDVNHFRKVSGLPNSTLLNPAHVPPLIDRYAAAEMSSVFGRRLKQLLRAKLRTSHDFEPNFGLSWFVQSVSQEKGASHARRILAANRTRSLLPADMKSLSLADAICRVTGSHSGSSDLQKVFGAGCAGALAANGSVQLRAWGDRRCRGEVAAKLTEAAFTWMPAPKSEVVFQMLRPSTNLNTLRRRLTDGDTRVACLNDDYPPSGASRPVDALIALLESLYPTRAGWEMR